MPEGWDRGIEWSVDVGDEPEEPEGLACMDPTAPGPCIVRLFPSRMDRFSDAACRWIIAHEFGHLAPVLSFRVTIEGQPCLFIDGVWRRSLASSERLEDLYEEAADRGAWEWGFHAECEAFAAEVEAEPCHDAPTGGRGR